MTDGAVDTQQTKRFIDALDPEGLGICWQTFDDDGDRKNRSLARTMHGYLDDKLVSELHRLQGEGAGVFITINAIPHGQRRLQTNVNAVRALFIDHDDKDGPLRAEFALEPSVVVKSGGGHHYYWLLKDGEPMEAWRKAQCMLIDYYGSDKACKDLCRVMRAPGWIHQKNAEKPVLVEIVHDRPDPRYSIDDVVQAHTPDKHASPVDRCRAYMRTVEPAVKGSGTGHSDTYRACLIGGDFGLSDEEFWPILRDWGATCTPPWDDMELHDMMEESTKYRKQSVGCRLSARSPDLKPEAEPEPEKRPALEVLAKLLSDGIQPEQACEWISCNVESAFEREACVKAIAAAFNVSVTIVRKELDRVQAALKPTENGRRSFGLKLPPMWEINRRGVFKRRPSKDGAWYVDESSQIAPRPIWPSELGTDLSTNDEWVRVSWHTAHGVIRDRWLQSTQLSDRATLSSLQGAPVSLGRINLVSDWLSAASGCIEAPPAVLLSSSGWIDGDLMLRESENVRYVGQRPLCKPGNAAEWLKGLQVLLDHECHTAMACLCMSFAAPMVRWLGRRCPVLGLVHESSRGKGTAINYALSLWTTPADLTAPAGSSIKGIQDMGTEKPDLPLFADDIHQLAAANRQDLAGMVYYLGNGQRRVTSSITQESVGGERRYGTAFYAAEYQVLGALPSGAVRRCIELHDAPMPGKHAAGRVQDATQNAGAMCDAAVAYYNAMDRHEEILRIVRWKDKLRNTEDMDGDDAEVLALMAWASERLQGVLGAAWETRDITRHVAEQLSSWRRSAADAVELALCDLVTMIMSTPVGQMERDEDRIVFDERLLAWRKIDPSDFRAAKIDVVMTHPIVQATLRQHQIETDMLLRSWASRGWLDSEDKRGRPYMYRNYEDKRVRVSRINAAGCALAYGGIDDSF